MVSATIVVAGQTFEILDPFRDGETELTGLELAKRAAAVGAILTAQDFEEIVYWPWQTPAALRTLCVIFIGDHLPCPGEAWEMRIAGTKSRKYDAHRLDQVKGREYRLIRRAA